MIRIRFHGRGGQGAKTASRIVGTAAFLEGYCAQDSPIYGAERRGAPVAAYTRMDRRPILERGIITQPDLVMVADETLLADPAARVLAGVSPDTVLFVNTPHTPKTLRGYLPITAHGVTRDLTGLALTKLGKGSALSAPLGAVAAKLAGLGAEHVRNAVERELGTLGLSGPKLHDNVELAMECFGEVQAVTLGPPSSKQPPLSTLWAPVYEPPARGAARIGAAANAPLKKTGDWRVFRPVLEMDKCNGCTLCFVYCPEGAISLTEDGRPVIDYDHCKGCGLCITECPTLAITAEREEVEEHS